MNVSDVPDEIVEEHEHDDLEVMWLSSGHVLACNECLTPVIAEYEYDEWVRV